MVLYGYSKMRSFDGHHTDVQGCRGHLRLRSLAHDWHDTWSCCPACLYEVRYCEWCNERVTMTFLCIVILPMVIQGKQRPAEQTT